MSRRVRAHSPKAKRPPVSPVKVRVMLTPHSAKTLPPVLRKKVLELVGRDMRRAEILSPGCVIVRNHPR